MIKRSGDVPRIEEGETRARVSVEKNLR